MRCVEGVLGLGGHVVIGVVLGFTTQTQYQVQISFLLDFVVHFCTCSQTVVCDRQFLSVANFCTVLHRENGSFEVLSLHPRQTWTYRGRSLGAVILGEIERIVQDQGACWPPVLATLLCFHVFGWSHGARFSR